MNSTGHLVIQSDPKHLATCRRFIEDHAKKAGFDDLMVSQIVLAVDEAVTNVIRHSYNMRPDCDIELKVELSEDEFKVLLRDYGKTCDPSKIKPRSLHEVRPGGLGTHFMKVVMDEVTYCQREQGTELIMVKKLKSSKK